MEKVIRNKSMRKKQELDTEQDKVIKKEQSLFLPS
jgi:hypothetical protein